MVDHVVLHFERKLKVVRKKKKPELFAALVNVYRNHEEDEKLEYLLWPTDFPGFITQAFGINPQHYNQFGLPGHEGLDMKAPQGMPIYSAWDGLVTRVDKTTQHPNYGWHIRLQNEYLGWAHEFVYAHFLEPSILDEGDLVKRGEVVGIADSTGNSTGSHLHFMLKQEKNGLEAIAHDVMGWPTASNGFTIIDPTPYFEELQG